jgi:hypothetical protein
LLTRRLLLIAELSRVPRLAAEAFKVLIIPSNGFLRNALRPSETQRLRQRKHPETGTV